MSYSSRVHCNSMGAARGRPPRGPRSPRGPSRGAHALDGVVALGLIPTLLNPRVDVWILAGVSLLIATGLVVVWRRRARAEAALRFSEAKFGGIVSIASDAIISVDSQQRITDFNRGAEDVFGYAASEAVGQPLSFLLPERFREVHTQHVDDFAAARVVARRMGERGDVEIIGLRKNGKEFPAEASISKMRIGEQRIFTVVLRDISARRREEQAREFLSKAGSLLASSLDYETTLHSIVRLAVSGLADWCVIYMRQEGGAIVRLDAAHANPAMESLIESLLMQPLPLDGPHPAKKCIEEGRVQVLTEVPPETGDILAANEEHLDVIRRLGLGSIIVAPLVARGHTLGALGLCSARPGRYTADDAALAEELARRAALAVDNARLYREARQAVKARNEVLSVVSHDLGNPLSAILINSRLLLKQDGGHQERRRDKLEGIRRAAEQMQRLIGDLLDVQRIEAGRLSLDRARHVLSRVLTDAVERAMPLAGEKRQELDLDIPTDLSDVSVDRDRILQVMGNLLGNAIKFTPAGGRIVVSARDTEDRVVVRVADSGPGIAASELPFVFDRFYQVRHAGHLGSGLGLAIAKGIVEAHGGEISIASDTGRGTTVSFSLPLDGRDDPRPTRVDAPASSEPERSLMD